MHTVRPLVHESNYLEFKIVVENLESFKSPSVNPIPAELIQARGNNTLWSQIQRH
jgi:hypothetical protein